AYRDKNKYEKVQNVFKQPRSKVQCLGDVSLLLFHLSDILINLYPTAFCVVAAYYLSHKANVSSVVLIIYSL
ncbi:hypothetical protein, partial [Vibrio parahaemolyticus]|uniref:hypothetical protein n=1 Tax=Vibrio parahaemolyticus TaxID=670 RepID=UPI001C91C5BC